MTINKKPKQIYITVYPVGQEPKSKKGKIITLAITGLILAQMLVPSPEYQKEVLAKENDTLSPKSQKAETQKTTPQKDKKIIQELIKQAPKPVDPRFKAPTITALNIHGQNIVNQCLKQGYTDNAQLAYILATAEHETAGWNYLEEIDGIRQAVRLNYNGGWNYYGRGYVHLTHLYNYSKYAKLLNILDLATNPERAKEPEVASQIICHWFKEKKLNTLINSSKIDYWSARDLVNGDGTYFVKRYNTTISDKIANRAMDYYNELVK